MERKLYKREPKRKTVVILAVAVILLACVVLAQALYIHSLRETVAPYAAFAQAMADRFGTPPDFILEEALGRPGGPA